jgi:pterin-4a-carbinolamine dehydratase
MWAWTWLQPQARLVTPTTTTRRRFGHKPATTPEEVRHLRVRRHSRTRPDYLSDALALLTGWTRDGVQIKRILAIDDSQHAALTERIKVAADTLHLRPTIRRLDGHTQISLGARDGGAITDGEVTLAARIEDAYRTITGRQ